MRLRSLAVACFLAVVCVPMAVAAERSVAQRPNIVYILADDLGYGDVRCFNAQGKIATPHLDRLAAAGVRFTDAHSSALAVCTPTGAMESLPGAIPCCAQVGSSRRLFKPPKSPDRLSVPEFSRQHGYRTACVCKRHLGIDWARKEGDQSQKIHTGWDVDDSLAHHQWATTVGFDDYFGISASLDMPPYLNIRRYRAWDSDGREDLCAKRARRCRI